MKYKLIIIIAFCILFSLILGSCNNNKNETSMQTIETTTSYDTQVETTNYYSTTSHVVTTNQINTEQPNLDHIIYSNVSSSTINTIDTDTRFYLLSSMQYINKLDGETYSLCFDPTCSHKKGTANPNCPVVAFAGSNFAYCETNQRIYMGRGDCIYSMNFDAGDIKLEYAFSDMGKDLTKNDISGFAMGYLSVCDDYLFFIKTEVITPEIGSTSSPQYKRYIFRFNVDNKELINLSQSCPNYSIISFVITKSAQLYVKALDQDGTEIAFFTDINFSDIEFVNYRVVSNYYDGETIIGTVYDDYHINENGNYVAGSNAIVSYNLITREYKIIAEKRQILNNNEGKYLIYGGKNGYIFYSVCNPFLIGKYNDKYNKEVLVANEYHTIYSMKLDGTDNKIVTEGLISNDPLVESTMYYKMFFYPYNIKIIVIHFKKQGSNPNDWQSSEIVYYKMTEDGRIEPIT